jgi:hypothetical protein
MIKYFSQKEDTTIVIALLPLETLKKLANVPNSRNLDQKYQKVGAMPWSIIFSSEIPTARMIAASFH